MKIMKGDFQASYITEIIITTEVEGLADHTATRFDYPFSIDGRKIY